MSGFHPLNLLQGDYGSMLLGGLWITLLLTLISWLIAFALGVLLAALRSLPSKFCDGVVAVYVAYHRNVPLLVQVLFWYFGVTTVLPDALQHWLNDHGGGLIPGAIALGLCMAAYVSEDLRSGIRTVGHGQTEAARAMGLSFAQTMGFIVLPQALRAALPALVSGTLLLFKNTSLLMAIGVADLTYATRQIDGQTFRTFEIFTVATVLYLGLSLVIMGAGHLLEQRLRIAGR
ncbi:amino acid ABC transporter permease [Variovorax sp. PBL-E5]|uniref:amino acid ABC transporter permease n=1 Tax=Variovorax sp. PBL-E5 TaxID=434014 RepID=UPI001317DF02|nr:amino acid ABC transporter permease [Variovorax sp. PBL-E5]VTU30165.1 putative glutamine ABC transporter permease protein GlnM [Variovorax sp. PBL-E5]